MEIQQDLKDGYENEKIGFEENDSHVDGSESSDTDDSEKEREEHYALERRVVELRKELSKSPNAYNTHVELISCLKKLGELDQLQHARESMHAIYPLTEELWLDWLRDEIKLSLSDEDKKKVESLFLRATGDYLSIDIWVEYIQFCLAGMDIGGAEALENIRTVMEEAIRHGGLHVVKGGLLWDSYRDFEMAIYQSTKAKTETENINQAKKITHLFNRQLSVPLLDMERTWKEYNDWLEILDQKVETHVKASYDKAKIQLEKISPLEDTLLIAVENDDKAAVYRTYLDLEINEIKDPSRIQALFERVVAEIPLYDAFWMDYCKYVDRQFKTAETTFAVFRRAVRNCPWNGPIWASYIFAAERYEKEDSFISGLVQNAFVAGLASAADLLAVWLGFIEYLVRKCKSDDSEQIVQLREAFTRATEHLHQSFDIEGDPECILLQYWAYFEAKKLNNMPKARELWRQIMGQGHGKSAQWWLARIQFERAHANDVTEVRKLFVKSINAVTSLDWPELIVKQWLQFEREEGDLQTMDNAQLRCDARMEKVKKERESNIVKDLDTGKGRKRGKTEENHDSVSIPPKKAKIGHNSASTTKSDTGNTTETRTNASQPVKPITIPQPIADPCRHANTVFLSNLDFNISEEDIRSTMSSSGTITDIRLVRDYKQRSKGFCYVEFSSSDEVKEALKRDREPLKGRPMFISPSEPDSALKHPAFKYQSTLEKKKLFVKGLASTTTKEDLENLFSKFGILKDVRLATFRTGISKGIAYVEFEDEVSATMAMNKTDGTTFQDRVLTVALSNPPPRYDKKTTDREELSLGGGARERKTQLSFVPISILRQAKSSTMPPPPPPLGAQKSNADFRSMLLNKK